MTDELFPEFDETTTSARPTEAKELHHRPPASQHVKATEKQENGPRDKEEDSWDSLFSSLPPQGQAGPMMEAMTPAKLPDTTEQLRQRPGYQRTKAIGKAQEQEAPPTGPDFAAALIRADEFLARPMVQRPRLLGEWMREGDLGYLFAPRGAGKSWMAMFIGQAVADGLPLGDWQAGSSPRPVVYFDAEMNISDLQERAQKMGIDCPNFRWLSNEELITKGMESVNIANVLHQAALSKALPDGSLFILDNLSTAQMGMEENSNDDFDKIKPWLLVLRARRITVLIVHHAGRSGQMRGGSRREDIAHWIISLKDASGDAGNETAFFTSFAKCRNCKGIEAAPKKWTMVDEQERITLACQAYSGPDAMLAHIREGVGTATELAELMGVVKSTISKWAKKLQEAGQITIIRREYLPVVGSGE